MLFPCSGQPEKICAGGCVWRRAAAMLPLSTTVVSAVASAPSKTDSR
jgi:hypothetical protein